MIRLRQVLAGILAAFISIIIVLGGFALAYLESPAAISIAPPPALVQTDLPLTVPLLPEVSTQPAETISTPMATATRTPTPTTSCPPQAGWTVIQVQPGDNWSDIAATYGISLQDLTAGNCLPGEIQTLIGGSYLNVPLSTSTPTHTRTPIPSPTIIVCQPPGGWIRYTVKAGDTLSSIGRAFGIAYQVIKSYNCLTSDLIVVGQTLYVPNVPTITPTRTRPPRPTKTPVPSATGTPVPPSPTSTPRPATGTPTPVPATRTPTPLPPTPTPTVLPPTGTASPTPIPSMTPTPTPTHTSPPPTSPPTPSFTLPPPVP